MIRNAPLLDDGTPMPTRYYLVDSSLVKAVSRLEAAGGVNQAEAEIDPTTVAEIHARYAEERDRALPVDHRGPAPFGGVGGTRTGIKCLHAHVANELAGGDDAVGRWALDHLADTIRRDDYSVEVLRPAPSVDGSVIEILVEIGDDEVTVTKRFSTTGEAVRSGQLPIGVHTLHQLHLTGDPPRPEMLANALGIVADHLDDVLRDDPVLLDTVAWTLSGRHVDALARVEVGGDEVPARYHFDRDDLEDVFRTLVAEPIAQRRHNPGLDSDHVESIVATCCIVLAAVRRLDLHQVGYRPPSRTTRH